MSSNPLPTIGPTMPIPLPPPIPPAMPMLPPTTALPVIPPPNHSSPLPPISTISTPPVTNIVLNSNNQLNETVKAHSGNDGSTVTPNGEATFAPKINQEGEHVVDGTDRYVYIICVLLIASVVCVMGSQLLYWYLLFNTLVAKYGNRLHHYFTEHASRVSFCAVCIQ